MGEVYLTLQAGVVLEGRVYQTQLEDQAGEGHVQLGLGARGEDVGGWEGLLGGG